MGKGSFITGFRWFIDKCSLGNKVRIYLQELKADAPYVPFRHFTTMASGYKGFGDEVPGGTYFFFLKE